MISKKELHDIPQVQYDEQAVQSYNKILLSVDTKLRLAWDKGEKTAFQSVGGLNSTLIDKLMKEIQNNGYTVKYLEPEQDGYYYQQPMLEIWVE